MSDGVTNSDTARRQPDLFGATRKESKTMASITDGRQRTAGRCYFLLLGLKSLSVKNLVIADGAAK